MKTALETKVYKMRKPCVRCESMAGTKHVRGLGKVCNQCWHDLRKLSEDAK